MDYSVAVEFDLQVMAFVWSKWMLSSWYLHCFLVKGENTDFW